MWGACMYGTDCYDCELCRGCSPRPPLPPLPPPQPPAGPPPPSPPRDEHVAVNGLPPARLLIWNVSNGVREVDVRAHGSVPDDVMYLRHDHGLVIPASEVRGLGEDNFVLSLQLQYDVADETPFPHPSLVNGTMVQQPLTLFSRGGGDAPHCKSWELAAFLWPRGRVVFRAGVEAGQARPRASQWRQTTCLRLCGGGFVHSCFANGDTCPRVL